MDQLIRTLIPKDKPFTLTDVMQWLYDATKGQQFREPDDPHLRLTPGVSGRHSEALQDGPQPMLVDRYRIDCHRWAD